MARFDHGRSGRVSRAYRRLQRPNARPAPRTPPLAQAYTESSTPALKDVRGVVGEPRALTAHQRHMPGMGPAAEAVHGVGEAGGHLGEIGAVDLRDVAETGELGTGTGARDQRLHLLGRQVLRLIEDQEAVDEGAAA